VGGQRISAIGIMSTGGMEYVYIAVYIAEGNINGEAFENFVRKSLLPILMGLMLSSHS